jgi:hypothetical protein
VQTEFDPLTPQGCFIAAKTIEREIGQIGEPQKAARKVNGRDSSLARQVLFLEDADQLGFRTKRGGTALPA